jgi:hypothetical protein
MLTFAQLMTTITPAQAKSALTVGLTNAGINVAGWRKGGVYDTIMTYVAYLYSAFIGLAVQATGSAFLDYASGFWLRYLSYYVFGIPTTLGAATFATGFLTMTNSGGGMYSYPAGGVIFLNGTTGQAYTNTAAITGLNPATSLTVAVQCTVIGSVGNAAPGQINTTQTTILGVTVTNAAAVVGQDPIPDVQLRGLCSAKLGTLSNGGPRTAYEYAIKSATRPDGSLVNINRVYVSNESSLGVVLIYVAAPSGAPDPLDVGYAQTNVDLLARPDGVLGTVTAATPVAVTRTFTAYAITTPGLLSTTIQAAALANLITTVQNAAIGGIATPPSTQGYLYAEKLRQAVDDADPSIYNVTDGGALDTALSPGQVATLNATVTVTFVTVG